MRPAPFTENMNIFYKIYILIFYAGAFKFTNSEKMILDAVRKKLPEGYLTVFDEQISKVDYIQRFLKRRITLICYIKYKDSLFPNVDERYCLAKIKLRGQEGSFTANLICSGGILRTLQYTRVPSKTYSIVETIFEPKRIVDVEIALDRLEHGKNND